MIQEDKTKAMQSPIKQTADAYEQKISPVDGDEILQQLFCS